MPTIDVWAGPWLFENSVIQSIGGGAMTVMRRGDVNITCCRVGGEAAPGGDGASDGRGAVASDCVVVSGEARLHMNRCDVSFASPAPSVAADAQIGAGGGISVMGKAACSVQYSHVHHCSRAIFLDDEADVSLESVGLSCLGKGALAAGANAEAARLNASNCVLHELGAASNDGPKTKARGAAGAAKGEACEAAPWINSRRPGFSSGEGNQFSLAV